MCYAIFGAVLEFSDMLRVKSSESKLKVDLPSLPRQLRQQERVCLVGTSSISVVMLIWIKYKNIKKHVDKPLQICLEQNLFRTFAAVKLL